MENLSWERVIKCSFEVTQQFTVFFLIYDSEFAIPLCLKISPNLHSSSR
jgi:hypothetical protein